MKSNRSLFWVVFIMLMGAGQVMAQNDGGIPTAEPADMPSASQMMAQRLTIFARKALATRDQTQPIEAQITQARILFSQANALDGKDAQRWLLTAEACSVADDRDGQIEALKQYMALAGDDDVAQLRLIDLLVSKMQTAEQRLGYMLKIAEGPLAARFTPALRSRVAFRAAMLAAAQGQPEEYGRLLTMALQLDSTNKAAAAESLRVLSASGSVTPAERAAAMLTLFQADPADARTHAAIGDMLMGVAQYEDAAAWFAQAVQIDNANHRVASIALLHQWALALWGAGHGAEAVALLARLDSPAPAADAAAGAADAATDNTAATKPAGDPNWPPLDSLMLRAVILACNGSPEDAAAAYDRLNERFVAQLQTAVDSPAVLAAQAWSQLLCNQNISQTAAILDQLAKLPDAGDLQLPLMRGWLAMRNNQPAQAAKLLSPLTDTDPRAALGMALSLVSNADAREQATKLLRMAVIKSPADIFGLVAASHLRRMSLPLPEPTDAHAVAPVFAAVPSSLRQMFADPMRFVQVRLFSPTLRYDFGQPITATLEIRNLSTYPLSMEAGGSIPGRVLLFPTATVDLRNRPQLVPVVMNVDRRLRLEPLRSMSLTIRLDNASLGALLTAAPWQRIAIDELVILNPTLNAGGSFVPGMLGSATQLRNIVRRNVPLTLAAVQQKITELGSADPAASMRAMAMLVAAIPNGDAATDEQKQAAEQIARALAEGWPGYSPIQQAYLVSLIPPNGEIAKLLSPVLTGAGRSPQPLVQVMLLVTQMTSADDPVLTAALRSSDATVHDLAQAVRTVLQLPKPEPAETPE